MAAATTEELERLKRRLREREDEVQQAAQAGLALLEQQVELQGRLDEQREEMTDALEALEQDKYSLQKELQLKTRMLDSLQTDYECMKNQQREELQRRKEHLERSHSMVLNDLQNKKLMLQSALDESQLKEKQLSHKLEVQSEMLSHKTEELQALNEQSQHSMTSEVMEVQMKLMDLEKTKEALEATLQEHRYKEQQLEVNNGSLQRQVERLTEEKEEREKEAVSCFNAMEKAREANRDLQVQLDQVLHPAQDPNSRGNSVFAELEDKRVEMERQLIGVKVQHQSLLKLHAFGKQQMQRMKVQIATLMQLQGSRADPAQVERLQAMLSEKNAEIQSLIGKLQKAEGLLQAQEVHPAPAPPQHDHTFYTNLLQMKLDNMAKDAARLGDELSFQRMKSLSESQRALELERKLFSSERMFKQTQSDKIKIQLRLEELQQKHEPKETKTNPVQTRRKEKLPVEVPAEQRVKEEEPEETLVAPAGQLEHKPAETEKADAPPGPRPAKCVRISEPEGREPEGENQQQRRRRARNVEMIHVNANSSMEKQCTQQ